MLCRIHQIQSAESESEGTVYKTVRIDLHPSRGAPMKSLWMDSVPSVTPKRKKDKEKDNIKALFGYGTFQTYCFQVQLHIERRRERE